MFGLGYVTVLTIQPVRIQHTNVHCFANPDSRDYADYLLFFHLSIWVWIAQLEISVRQYVCFQKVFLQSIARIQIVYTDCFLNFCG